MEFLTGYAYLSQRNVKFNQNVITFFLKKLLFIGLFGFSSLFAIGELFFPYRASSEPKGWNKKNLENVSPKEKYESKGLGIRLHNIKNERCWKKAYEQGNVLHYAVNNDRNDPVGKQYWDTVKHTIEWAAVYDDRVEFWYNCKKSYTYKFGKVYTSLSGENAKVELYFREGYTDSDGFRYTPKIEGYYEDESGKVYVGEIKLKKPPWYGKPDDIPPYGIDWTGGSFDWLYERLSNNYDSFLDWRTGE